MSSSLQPKASARHPENTEIYLKLSKLKTNIEAKKNQNAVYCYTKVLTTIEKYPLPIVSLQQAFRLEGVGDKVLTHIKSIIEHKYIDYKRGEDEIARENENKAKSKINEFFAKETKKVKSAKLQNFFRKKTVKEQKNKKEVEISGYIIITSMYLAQKDNINPTSFTKKDIQDAIGTNKNFDAAMKSDINSKTLKRLEKSNLLAKEPDCEEVKYMLTDESLKLAETYLKNLCDQTTSGLKQTSLTSSGVAMPNNPNKTPLTLNKCNIKNYEVTLLIDNREKKMKTNHTYFFDELKFTNIPVMLRNLPLADFAWTVDITTVNDVGYSYLLDYVVERKTVDDLVSSIKDGRYKDQKKRLKNSDITHVYYLIEGNLDKEKGFPGLTPAIAAIRLVNNFTMMRTDNARASVDFLIKVHSRMKKHVDDLINKDSVTFKRTYEDFFKRQNKYKNMKLRNATFNAIRRIKGFGEGSAIKLVKYCPTIADMYEKFNQDWEKQEKTIKSFLNKNQRNLLSSLLTGPVDMNK